MNIYKDHWLLIFRRLIPLHSAQAKKIQQKAYEGRCNRLFSVFNFSRGEKGDEWFLLSLTEFVRCQLANGKGAAFFVEPNSGTLGPFESLTINIIAFTNMWGEYQDNLICKVSHSRIILNFVSQIKQYIWLEVWLFLQVGDLDPASIPIQMSVRGCPIYFQLTGPQPNNQNHGPFIRSLTIKDTSACLQIFCWTQA